MMKLSLLASACAMAIASGPAHAQTTATSPNTAPSTETPKEQTGIEEIVITAQRVRESAQKAPIAISVVKSEDLVRLNVMRAEDLSFVVPALVATASGGPNTSFFIRGVGNTTNNAYSDPAISFNYDGVYVGRPNATQGFFYDLERVEVLKGPQGTLYGRNATGGAINVLPNRPDPKRESAEFQASFGNYKSVQVQGALNRPISESAALRLSATYNKHDGYYSDGTGDQDQKAFRVQLLAKPAPSVTTRFAADYSHQGGAGTGSFVYGTYALVSPAAGYAFTPTPQLGPKVGAHDPRTEAFMQTRFIAQAGRTSEAVNSYPSQDNAVMGVSNETHWTTDAGTLTVQAAMRESRIASLSTTSNFRGFFIDEKDDQSTVEARFTGRLGDKADFLIGGFFFDEKIDNKSAINQLTSLPIQNYETGTNSKAVFGRLAFRATDELTLTVAGRYTDDLKTMKGLSNVYTVFCGSPAPPQDFCPTVPLMPLVRTAAEVVAFYTARGIAFGPPGTRGANTPTINNTQIAIDSTLATKKSTFRVAADFQVTPSNLVYVSHETGFHGGGFNFGRGLETYEPETIAASTVGSKNRFFNNRLQLNVEAFYWKYKDQQISQFGTDFSTPPISVFYTSNIGRSTIKGFDVDFEVRPTSATRISGSAQYLDTAYTSYTVYTGVNATPNFACPYSTTTYRGAAAFAVDCSGKPALFSPKWSFNLGVEQTVEIGNFSVIGRVGTRYRGDFFAATSYQSWVVSEAGFQSDASLTLEPHSDRWSLTAFANNIENTRRITQSNVNGTLFTQSAVATAPRTYGLRVGARF